MKKLYEQLQLKGWVKSGHDWVRNQPQIDVKVTNVPNKVKLKTK